MFIIPTKLYLDQPVDEQSISSYLSPFELSACDYGLKQKKINFDYLGTYLNHEWITPTPQTTGLYFEVNKPRLELLKSSIESIDSNDLRIIEIGGGDNLINTEFALTQKNVKSATCIDPALDDQININRITKIKDFFPKGLHEDSFDFAFTFNTIEHVVEVEKFIQGIYDCLKINGKLLISAPECTRQILQGDWNLLTQQHISYFVQSGLIEIFLRFNFMVQNIILLNDEIFLLLNKSDKRSQKDILKNEVKVNLKKYEILLKHKLNIFEKIIEGQIKEDNKIVVHGATSGILNLVANSRYFDYLKNNLILLDSDPLKIGKYLSFFQNPIVDPNKLLEVPDLLLISSLTFENSIRNFWYELKRCKLVLI